MEEFFVEDYMKRKDIDKEAREKISRFVSRALEEEKKKVDIVDNRPSVLPPTNHSPITRPPTDAQKKKQAEEDAKRKKEKEEIEKKTQELKIAEDKRKAEEEARKRQRHIEDARKKDEEAARERKISEERRDRSSISSQMMIPSGQESYDQSRMMSTDTYGASVVPVHHSSHVTPHIPKKKEYILTSSKGMESHCILGKGGFGEVLLVSIKGCEGYSAYKKIIKQCDKTVYDSCEKEFRVQRKLFKDRKCGEFIAKPLYILDCLDANYVGGLGFCMELCPGGSVSDFVLSWASTASRIEIDPSDSEEEDCTTSSPAFNPYEIDPLKVGSICVEMIICLDEVLQNMPTFIHRDIKPDNYLVRVDPDTGRCGLILGDLGLAQISDSISSSKDSLSFSVSSVISSGSVVSSSKSSKTIQKEDRKVICGTYAYNSPEALFGNHSKDSDAYALGMSMYAAFSGHAPFLSNRAFDEFFHPDGTVDNAGVIQKMLEMMHNRDFPKIEWCPLFRKLKEMPHGDEIYSCLKEVYDGFIEYDAGD
ncbi:hypothetical protein ADUPG1_010811, partial [Aduncisulcus paluster]